MSQLLCDVPCSGWCLGSHCLSMQSSFSQFGVRRRTSIVKAGSRRCLDGVWTVFGVWCSFLLAGHGELHYLNMVVPLFGPWAAIACMSSCMPCSIHFWLHGLLYCNLAFFALPQTLPVSSVVGSGHRWRPTPVVVVHAPPRVGCKCTAGWSGFNSPAFLAQALPTSYYVG